MNDQTEKIDEIFWAALQIKAPAEQAAYLDRRCGEDRGLRELVEKLLRAQPKAQQFLEQPFEFQSPTGNCPTLEQPPLEKPGTQIGPYKLLQQIITVLVNGDRLGESDEYFFVNFSNPIGAGLNSNLAYGLIFDDEPRIYIDGAVSIAEGNTGTKAMNFNVILSAASDFPVTVNFVTADLGAVAGTDYVANAGTLTFAPGQTSLPITVLVKGDLLVEGDESISVQLYNVTNGMIPEGFGYGWGYGTILDDDTPPAIDISDASVVEGNSGTKQLSFTVTLSHLSDKEVRVKFATANGTAKTSDNDYVSKSGTLTFAAGETSKTIAVTITGDNKQEADESLTFAPGETTKTITVTIKGDKKKEADEYFYVKLSGASNGTIANSQAVGTILDDDNLD